MTTRFRIVFLASYIFVMILFLVLGYFSKRALDRVDKYVVVLGRDHEVVITFQNILISLSRAESNRRGYIISNDKHYLDSYTEAVSSLQKSLQDLRVLNNNGRYQDIVLDSLDSKIGRRLKGLQASLQLAIRDTSADSLQVIFTDRGRQSMEMIRAAIYSLLDERRSDRTDIYQNLSEFNSDVRSLYTIVIFMVFWSFPGFAVVTYFQFKRVSIMERSLRQKLALAGQQVQYATDRYMELKRTVDDDRKTNGKVS